MMKSLPSSISMAPMNSEESHSKAEEQGELAFLRHQIGGMRRALAELGYANRVQSDESCHTDIGVSLATWQAMERAQKAERERAKGRDIIGG